MQSIRFYGRLYRAESDRLKTLFPEADIFELPIPANCHPGCFPKGTGILTPDGVRLIETILPGDSIATFEVNSAMNVAVAEFVSVTDNWIWIIDTEVGYLETTETQPLCLLDGDLRQAGEVKVGDSILYRFEYALRSVQVLNIRRTDRFEKVYNVVLDNSQLFLAAGFLARSKPPDRNDGRSIHHE